MAVRTLEELLTDVRTVVNEDTSDEVLTLIENVTDTFNAASNTEEIETLKNQLAEQDAAWRKRFRDRFFNAAAPEPESVEPEEEQEEKPTRYEDLFN